MAKAQEIGGRIKQARLEAGGMKQRELAELLGVTERSVIAYEAGEVIPYRFIRELERILGRSASWILHGEDATAPDDRFEQVLEEILALRKEVRALTRAVKK